jgi:hypothetical protein
MDDPYYFNVGLGARDLPTSHRSATEPPCVSMRGFIPTEPHRMLTHGGSVTQGGVLIKGATGKCRLLLFACVETNTTLNDSRNDS